MKKAPFTSLAFVLAALTLLVPSPRTVSSTHAMSRAGESVVSSQTATPASQDQPGGLRLTVEATVANSVATYSITLRNPESSDIGPVYVAGVIPGGATFNRALSTPAESGFQGVVDGGPSIGQVAVWLSRRVPAGGEQGPFAYEVSLAPGSRGQAHAWAHWTGPTEGTATSPTVTPTTPFSHLPVPGGTLDPMTVPKYREPLVIPPVMQPDEGGGRQGQGIAQYQIAARQFQQQVLPAGMPKTTVWGYGRFGDPLPGTGSASSFNYPAFTVETRTNEAVRVRWVNQLVDQEGNFLPHLLPVDPTLHWANPPGPIDSRPTFDQTPGPYRGPVPLVTHLHGAHVPAISDGHPEAWYLPAARDIPGGYATRGSHYGSVIPAPAGSVWFEYPNDQPPTTLWYHDHALGITRLNVYPGLAGFWLIRGPEEESLNLPGPAPRLGDPPGERYYEIPIAIQDRSFNDDGSWFYPPSRTFFDEYPGPFLPETPVSPIWNPEVFGNTMVVNGQTWPYLLVEPRLYRLRLLNGSDARFLILRFDKEGLQFHQIGAEGGFLPAPARLDQILMGPAERADVLVDFSSLQVDDVITLVNHGPDEPFKGFNPDGTLSDGEGGTLPAAHPFTTGQVMRFKVVPGTNLGNSGQIPASLPAATVTGEVKTVRDLTLNEEIFEAADIPVAALLGTASDGPLGWEAPITENPGLGDTEIWRLINLTVDAHPIHPHLVQFQLLDRIPFDAGEYMEAQLEWLDDANPNKGPAPDPMDFATGDPIPPEPGETGLKDTVIAFPGQITRFRASFDLPGLYVWHCHILEHEDNEMMRPYFVGPMP